MESLVLLSLAVALVASVCAVVATYTLRSRAFSIAPLQRDRTAIEHDNLVMDVVRDRTNLVEAMDAERSRYRVVALPADRTPNGVPISEKTYTYDDVGRLSKVTDDEPIDVEVLVGDDGALRIVRTENSAGGFSNRTILTTYYLAPDRTPLVIVQSRTDSSDGERRWYFLAGEYVAYRDDHRLPPGETEYRYVPDTPEDIAELRADLAAALERFDTRKNVAA